MSIPASAVSPLFHGLFDDAALFPPGNAAMPAAVRTHIQHRRAWYAGLVGWFVCPAARASELSAELAAAGLGPFEVSLTVPGGPSELAGAVASARSLPAITVAAVELPLTGAELPAARAELAALAATGTAVFAEIAAGALSPSLAAELAAAGLGVKLRTGGTAAAAFPGCGDLGTAIGTAVTAGLVVKCTAGLHHAVAHHDSVTGFDHHGFLNVLLAVHAALSGADPSRPLAVEDPAELASAVAMLDRPEVAALRERFHSIGSCSIDEPLTDLDDLELVDAP